MPALAAPGARLVVARAARVQLPADAANELRQPPLVRSVDVLVPRHDLEGPRLPLPLHLVMRNTTLHTSATCVKDTAECLVPYM